MRKAIFAMMILLILIANVQALDYEEKPTLQISMAGSNQFSSGEERMILLTVFNPAKRVEIEYDDLSEAKFFGDGDMLFTAYNVSIELVGNSAIEVQTPTQKLPALPAMNPVTLQYFIKVKDDASSGKYTIKAVVRYEIVNKLVRLETFPTTTIPEKLTSTISYVTGSLNQTITNTTTSGYSISTKEYKLEYIEKEIEIPLTVNVEKEDVRLEILNVSTTDLIGGGKGKIEVEVRNAGEKPANNAYIVLETPSGFEAESLSISQPLAGTTGLPTSGLSTGLPSSPIGTAFPTASMSFPSTSTSAIPSTGNPAYFVGDLEPGESTKAVFYVKVNVKDGGRYPLKVKAVYLDESWTLKESKSVPFGIDVISAPSVIIKNVESKVFANAKGELRVTFSSTADLEDVSVFINANPPISVLSSEYYIGDLKKEEEKTAIFKVSASDEAKPIPYPAEIYLKYRTMDEYSETSPVKIGIEVNPKLEFGVEGVPEIEAGKEEIVTFTIKNEGNYTIRDATARLTVVDPFSSTDNSAFVGDLSPGESKDILFKIKVDGSATPKTYGLNLEVKYKDPEGEWVISEPVKALIKVNPRTGVNTTMLAGIIIAIVLVIVAYKLLRK